MRTNTLLIVAALLAVSACSGGGSNSSYGGATPTSPTDNNPAPTTPNTINANPGLAYNPTSLTITKGMTVTFNFGSVGHSVTFTSPGSPNSIPVMMNAAVGVAFPNSGTFNFYCTVHTSMRGTITVQ